MPRKKSPNSFNAPAALFNISEHWIQNWISLTTNRPQKQIRYLQNHMQTTSISLRTHQVNSNSDKTRLIRILQIDLKTESDNTKRTLKHCWPKTKTNLHEINHKNKNLPFLNIEPEARANKSKLPEQCATEYSKLDQSQKAKLRRESEAPLLT